MEAKESKKEEPKAFRVTLSKHTVGQIAARAAESLEAVEWAKAHGYFPGSMADLEKRTHVIETPTFESVEEAVDAALDGFGGPKES